MGLFDVFGAGGGTAAIQIAATMVGAGSSLEGNVVFTGGKRAQQITCVTMRVSQSTTSMHMTKEGPRQHTQSRDVVASFQIAGATTSAPGHAQAFPFSINIPLGAPPSQPGHVSYSLHANVDIPGEIDSGASVQLTVVGGMQQPTQPMQPMQGMQPMGYPQAMPLMPPMPPMPPQMGSFVVAQHPSGSWAPGRVTAMQSGMIGVDWDDPMLGASTWVSPAQVRVK